MRLADHLYKIEGPETSADCERRRKHFECSELFADLKSGRRRVRVDCTISAGDWSQKETRILPLEFWAYANYMFCGEDPEMGLYIWHLLDRESKVYINPIVIGADEFSLTRKRTTGADEMERVLPEVLRGNNFKTRKEVHRAVLKKLGINGDAPRGYKYDNFIKQTGPQLTEAGI